LQEGVVVAEVLTAPALLYAALAGDPGVGDPAGVAADVGDGGWAGQDGAGSGKAHNPTWDLGKRNEGLMVESETLKQWEGNDRGVDTLIGFTKPTKYGTSREVQ
jgi:hypothetical protein